ncbi:MAG: hypothetical protein JSW61_12190 [Candidatus Thorarchaeota archaeon]|nr:MAG: hypothetical protein JSW61_12190 [Candidatus Thorarchaeota archaeon]
MNEFGILIRLLTRTGDPIGASVDDMLEALGLPEVSGRHPLYRKLAGLHRRLTPVGLAICHNPVHHVYYLDAVVEADAEVHGSALPDRLAATLLVVITLAYQEGGWVRIDQVRELRKKSLQGVRADLRELASLGYVEVDKGSKKVRPGMRVPFEIDYDTFFSELGSSK